MLAAPAWLPWLFRGFALGATLALGAPAFAQPSAGALLAAQVMQKRPVISIAPGARGFLGCTVTARGHDDTLSPPDLSGQIIVDGRAFARVDGPKDAPSFLLSASGVSLSPQSRVALSVVDRGPLGDRALGRLAKVRPAVSRFSMGPSEGLSASCVFLGDTALDDVMFALLADMRATASAALDHRRVEIRRRDLGLDDEAGPRLDALRDAVVRLVGPDAHGAQIARTLLADFDARRARRVARAAHDVAGAVVEDPRWTRVYGGASWVRVWRDDTQIVVEMKNVGPARDDLSRVPLRLMDVRHADVITGGRKVALRARSITTPLRQDDDTAPHAVRPLDVARVELATEPSTPLTRESLVRLFTRRGVILVRPATIERATMSPSAAAPRSDDPRAAPWP